ncbi:MAG: dihydrolipoamide acetyltransferase family protein [Acidobacteriota bacterium]|nr:dihydrolipoamide acetyltransferase family protein [Acidobacteriota bacterium]
MTTKVIMPQMGESVFEGTLTKWLKKVGDSVAQDEPLFEISTDKVDSEIPSPASGILQTILVPEGSTVQINTVVAIINGADAKPAETQESQPAMRAEVDAKSEPGEPSQSFPQTELSAQTVAKVEEVRAHEKGASGVLSQPGITVQDIRTSPLVRRLARENKVDLSKIKGSGLEGRITKDDLLGYLAQRSAPEKPVPPLETTQAPTGVELPANPEAGAMEIPRFFGESESVPMTPMRKAIAEHMVFSKKTSAHVNTVFEIDVSSLVYLREMHKVEFEKRVGVRLTYTPFFAKALVDVVREFPIFNSSISGDSILYKKPINLGIAVALDSGLIVPVIRDAHLKSLTGLAVSINDLSERARNKKLKPDEVKNGTISMTNPGRYGALFNTPIINQPQVAILGIGGIEKRPVVINDAIAIRSMVCLSLTFDHRVIDGAEADRFMARIKEKLQSWTQWTD